MGEGFLKILFLKEDLLEELFLKEWFLFGLNISKVSLGEWVLFE